MKPATRPAATRWIAAGSSAAVLAGGLFLGAPAAHAAPGDPACAQASTQFQTALGAAGLTEAYVAQLETATDAVVTAGTTYAALIGANEPESIAAAEAAATALVTAQLRVQQANTALTAAQASGDPAAISPAHTELATAQAELDVAAAVVVELETAHTPAVSTPQIAAAEQALIQATTALEQLLVQLNLDEASATHLLTLFQAYLTTCATAPAASIPVPLTPAPVTPVVAAPVTPAEAAPVVAAPVHAPPVVTAPVEASPVAVNQGMNMQTAVAAEPVQHPGVPLLMALAAAGVGGVAAKAMHRRRAQRHQD